MNKNGRLYRTLKAAKNAFFDGKYAPDKHYTPSENKSEAEEQTNVLNNDNPKTVDDLKHEYCIGCSACFNACPVDAITLEPDDKGYFCRVVDFDKCIHCGKCAKVCPVINTPQRNEPKPECYAVMADDEIRRNSSSGGTFSLLANYILDNGGYVCGAAFAEDFSVEHIIISSKDELYRLRGSKYVQSRLDKVFTQVKELLKDGKTVLFSGCPCQVAGLNNFLGKDYDNLYTLDLVCHGGPSQKAFLQYLDEYYGRENLADFKFRTKEYGYNSFNQIAYLKDGTKIGGNIKFDPYERAMHSGLALKDICADCMFAPAPRQGDISTGDFWGVSKHKAELNDNLGTSVTLLNNEKGKALFEKVKESAKLFEAVPYDFARVNNRFGQKMRIPRSGRRWFYQMAEGQSFEKSVDYALKRKFDVGVIGLWYGRNYGSMATYFALHQVLTNKFHLSVLMIETPLRPDKYEVTRTHPRHVADLFYDVSQKYPLADLNKLNNFCDAFIVGSDQLWNVGLSRPYKQMYFLGFADERVKKIAYGTSFGKEYRGSEEEKMVSSYNLRRFDHVSVRDKLSLDIARNQFGVADAIDVCDPTFLCPLDEYQKLVDRAEANESEKYILAYFLDPNEAIGRELEKLAAEKKCKVIVLLDEPPWLWEQNVERLHLTEGSNVEVKRDVTLFDWLWYYKNAQSVVTDSFHGTIFSLIYNKPFMTLMNTKRGGARFISLLTPLELTDRLFERVEQFYENNALLDELDYTVANKKLDEIRTHSMNWLENSLFSEKKFDGKTIYSSVDNRSLDK